jgi:hypothetical protein
MADLESLRGVRPIAARGAQCATNQVYFKSPSAALQG